MKVLGVRPLIWAVLGVTLLTTIVLVVKGRYSGPPSKAGEPVASETGKTGTAGPVVQTPVKVSRVPTHRVSPGETSSAALIGQDRTDRTSATVGLQLHGLRAAVLDKAATAAREATLDRLRQAGYASLPAFGEALQSSSPEVRQKAATALRDIGTADAALLLMEAIATESDPARKRELEEVLATWSDPQAAQVFLEALSQCHDERSREVIARALAPFLTHEMAAVLLQQFNRAGQNADFRLAVAEALSRARPDAVSMALADYLNSTSDEAAIRYLADAAAKTGTHAVAVAVLDMYRRMGTDKNFELFMRAIGGITDPRAVSAFAEALGRHDDQSDVWKIAAVGLSSFGTAEAVDVLVKEARLAQEGSERRQRLIDEIARVKNPSALENLVKAYDVNEQNQPIARALAQAILNCGEDMVLKQYGEEKGQEYVRRFRQLLEPGM
ncbi:HEAT repeat domain-containing protein [Candidatus Sumerlaeota bacterium]|nr:HEAT repeat domain-containing protein [Candidatus Sumerlaeota bacterium]